MKPLLIPANSSNFSIPIRCFTSFSPTTKTHNSAHISTVLILRQSKLAKLISGKSQSRFISSNSPNTTTTTTYDDAPEEVQWNAHVGNPNSPPLRPSASAAKLSLSLSDQAFFLLSFITCMTTIAFTSLVIAAVPTLYAMGRAATSLSKLADTAREELPSTMAAIRLSGMEISDLTLELSDLSQEIADGVSKSSQAVQAAEAGIQKIGSVARQQTISIIQERASLPIISLQPIVVGAAKKTSRAVGQATKTLMNIISQRELSSETEESDELDRLEI